MADQSRCKEFPAPSDAQRENLAVECSSVSGVLAGACLTAGFGGKCTVQPEPGTKDGVEVRRFYTGRDLAYERHFCVNTALGVWSTVF